MSHKILQDNLNFSISRTELEAAWLDAAQPIADTPGLRWKVWLMNEAEHEAGGIYLFESEGAATVSRRRIPGWLTRWRVHEKTTLKPA